MAMPLSRGHGSAASVVSAMTVPAIFETTNSPISAAVGFAAAFSLAGGYLGSWLAIRRGAGFIRKIMLVVLAILIVRLAVEWFA